MISERRASAAEVDGLQVGEQAVVALDRQHRLARRDPVALVQRVHLQLVPAGDPAAVRVVAAGAQLQDRDRLVDPAQQRVVLLEHLHRDVRMVVLGLEQLLGVDEVGVRVVALPDPLHRQAEDLGIEASGTCVAPLPGVYWASVLASLDMLASTPL